MTAATFTGRGRGKTDPEEQFIDAPGEDTEEDFLLVLEDADKQPKEGKQGASKSKGKKLAQATEGAEAPPQETHQIPNPPNHTPTQPLQNPGQAPARLPPRTLPRPPLANPPCPPPQTPDEDEPPAPTKYVKAYQAAGKEWLDSVVKDGEAAYTKLFDKLLALGDPYIDNLDQADKEQVFKCIRDKTGRFLDYEDFMMYIETEEEKTKA